jgi:hypothetical protein
LSPDGFRRQINAIHLLPLGKESAFAAFSCMQDFSAAAAASIALNISRRKAAARAPSGAPLVVSASAKVY